MSHFLDNQVNQLRKGLKDFQLRNDVVLLKCQVFVQSKVIKNGDEDCTGAFGIPSA